MSTKEILQQIHDEADHIVGMENLIEQIIIEDAKAIKRLVKRALRPPRSIKVKKWIRSGELNRRNRTQASILKQCGRALDKNNACDILGDVLYQATNGKYYVINVEAVIEEANPEYVTDVLNEEADNR
jgi:hypothetical protein